MVDMAEIKRLKDLKNYHRSKLKEIDRQIDIVYKIADLELKIYGYVYESTKLEFDRLTKQHKDTRMDIKDIDVRINRAKMTGLESYTIEDEMLNLLRSMIE